jgi:hypothetical protein
MAKKKILKNKKSTSSNLLAEFERKNHWDFSGQKTPYSNLLANLECKNHWGFRDAVGLICQRPDPRDDAFAIGIYNYSETSGAFKTVENFIKKALIEKQIRLISGNLKSVSVATLILDRDSFLLWYSQNKDKIKQYLSCGNLSIRYEEFLDILAKENVQINSKIRDPHPDTDKAKKNRLREDYISAAAKMLIKNPDLKWPDFKDAPSLKNLIRESGHPQKESTIQRNWIHKARTKAKVTGKPGAPKKKKPTS